MAETEASSLALSLLREFRFSIPRQPEFVEFLETQGYQRRSGSVAYDRPYLTIVPFKKWYWEDSSRAAVHVEPEVAEKVVREGKLNVSCPYAK